MRTPIYLRDLKNSMIEDTLRTWERKGKTDLIKAYKDDEDIEIGEYFDDDEVTVE